MSTIKIRELNKYIKKYIAMDYLLSDLEVEGEISNYKVHSNRNVYFTLKDDFAKINSIMYSNDYENLKFAPKDGDNVIVKGSVSLYEKEGSINLYVREIKLNGTGDLYEKYVELKDKLYKEGLFEESHKLKIPYFPKRVGVITSPTGAAIRDIINVISRRNSAIDIVLYPANVQGNYAIKQLVKGLEYFRKNPVDVIILGRGGGSLEELFEFNSEELARKIYDMDIPVISAVGHEIDYVISDFVSDLRAPTPSAAAELVSMSKEDLNNSLFLLMNRINNVVVNHIDLNCDNLQDTFNNLNKIINDRLKTKKIKLNLKLNKLYLKSPINEFNIKKIELENTRENLISIKLDKKISKLSEELDNIKNTMYIKIEKLISEKKLGLFKEKEKLQNPKFSSKIYLTNETGRYINSVDEISLDENIKINFLDGRAIAQIKDISFRGGKNE